MQFIIKNFIGLVLLSFFNINSMVIVNNCKIKGSDSNLDSKQYVGLILKIINSHCKKNVHLQGGNKISQNIFKRDFPIRIEIVGIFLNGNYFRIEKPIKIFEIKDISILLNYELIIKDFDIENVTFDSLLKPKDITEDIPVNQHFAIEGDWGKS